MKNPIIHLYQNVDVAEHVLTVDHKANGLPVVQSQ